jgi:hypothetical protein
MTETDEIPPTLRLLARTMKATKVAAVRSGREVDHLLVDVYRSGKRVMRVAVPTAEDCLVLLTLAPGAVMADYIAMAADVWGSSSGTNPITGRAWELGEMGKVVSEDLGLHRQIIQEKLLVLGFARDGRVYGGTQNYEHDRTRHTITWQDLIPVGRNDGRFPKAALDGFSRRTVLEAVLEVTGGQRPDGFNVEAFAQKCAATWVLQFPGNYRVIEGPKGPPLADGHGTWLYGSRN